MHLIIRFVVLWTTEFTKLVLEKKDKLRAIQTVQSLLQLNIKVLFVPSRNYSLCVN